MTDLFDLWLALRCPGCYATVWCCSAPVPSSVLGWWSSLSLLFSGLVCDTTASWMSPCRCSGVMGCHTHVWGACSYGLDSAGDHVNAGLGEALLSVAPNMTSYTRTSILGGSIWQSICRWQHYTPSFDSNRLSLMLIIGNEDHPFQCLEEWSLLSPIYNFNSFRSIQKSSPCLSVLCPWFSVVIHLRWLCCRLCLCLSILWRSYHALSHG